MLRRLTLGLFTLVCAAAVAACSSSGNTVPTSGGVQGVGPNFKTNTIYVSDTTGNELLIYTPSPGPSATPQFVIGGSNTSLNNPRYLAFTSKKNLFVTNYNSGTQTGSVTVYQTYATGNVLPITTAPLVSGPAQPHGIAIFPNDNLYAVALTAPGQFFTSSVGVFGASGNALQFLIAGSNTGLDAPNGVAVDSNSNLYVSNTGSESGIKSVTVYALPSPTPTPSGSPSPTPSPTPTPSVSPSPTPTPTPFSNNLTPVTTITSASFVTPYGLALDSKGNLYVTDVGAPGQAPKVFVFSAPFGAGAQSLSPSATITSSALVYPTDVKVDAAGNIYVVDLGSGPSSNSGNTSKLLIFPPNSNGNVTPSVSIALPQGSATGLGLSP